jgi:hypothetical protein
MSGQIHSLLTVALLVPYIGLGLGMLGLISYICWKR